MMTEKDVVELISIMRKHDFEVLLDGGWGIDALLGRQTRAHDDIDLFIEQKDGSRFIKLLKKNGYKEIKKEYSSETHSVWRDAKKQIIDLHLFAYAEDRSFMFEGQKYAPDTFDAVGVIAGRQVRCIPPEYQLMFHLGYDHDENDAKDVGLLCEHFGLPLPQEYR